MSIYGFKTYHDEKTGKVNNPNINDMDILKNQLVNAAKHHMFSKNDYRVWGNPHYGDDNDKKEEKIFSRNNLGYCYLDQGDNYIVYDFKKKKFVLFDHELTGNDNIKENSMSINQVASYIKRDISSIPKKYLMNESFYDLIFDEIIKRYENGELTYEQAEEVNNLAYEKYVGE